MLSHLRDGGGLENKGDLNLEMRDFIEAAENACGEKGVSAQREEIIVKTDLFDLQRLCKDSGECFLERRPWRNGSLRQGRAGRETQFSRQADTLHFPGGTFWDFRDDEHLARDLKGGDAPHREPTNVFR